MSYSTTQRAIVEFIGTLALIFIGAGSILADKATGGGTGLAGIALAHGLTVAVMVSAIGHISGGHITTGDAAAYWIAQLAGGVAGAFLLVPLFDAPTREAVHLGTPALAPGVSAFQGLIFEAIATFFLVFVVCATAIDERGAFKALGGFPIGLVVAFDILAGGPLTGASMNPARTFGPALVSGFWTNHAIYWAGPLLGGGLAALLYSRVYLGRREDRVKV